VAVGSLYVTGKMGWIGYDAVHPAHQGHRYQRAIIIARMHHARSLGCELLHVETMSEAQGEFSPSLRSMLGSGFNYVYDRSYFEPVEVGSP
jgi:GNAT superfamily N-acetyltransferase